MLLVCWIFLIYASIIIQLHPSVKSYPLSNKKQLNIPLNKSRIANGTTARPDSKIVNNGHSTKTSNISKQLNKSDHTKNWLMRQPHAKIVGGHSTTIVKNPWQIQLLLNGHFKCGGSLLQMNRSKLQSDIVLTAAHCMKHSLNPAEYSVIVGSDHRLKGKQIKVKKFRIHKNYERTESFIHDIALIKLARPIQFTNRVKGIQLPQQGQSIPPNPEHCKATGFGATSEGLVVKILGGRGSNSLLEVQLPYMSMETCTHKYPGLQYVVKGLAFCAGYEHGGMDSCKGDSGGPFVCVGNNHDNDFVQYGIVSWGDGCARAGAPGIYTNVAEYKTWIYDTVHSLQS